MAHQASHRCFECGALPDHQDREYVAELKRRWAIVELTQDQFSIVSEGHSQATIIKTKTGYVFQLDDAEALSYAHLKREPLEGGGWRLIHV